MWLVGENFASQTQNNCLKRRLRCRMTQLKDRYTWLYFLANFSLYRTYQFKGDPFRAHQNSPGLDYFQPNSFEVWCTRSHLVSALLLCAVSGGWGFRPSRTPGPKINTLLEFEICFKINTFLWIEQSNSGCLFSNFSPPKMQWLHLYRNTPSVLVKEVVLDKILVKH